MSSPRVSFVIPCFNLGAYLEEAVDSCLTQGIDDLEIVVIDDGSDETRTLGVLESFERPRTRIIRCENRGLAAARNLGAAHARGKYISFLDADDRLAPGFLERTVAALDSLSADAFASCWLEAFGDETWTYRPERCDLAQVLAECTIVTPALVRRERFKRIGGFDEEMPAMGNEDWDLWVRLLAAGQTGVIVPEVLFHYRRRRDSMVDDCYYGSTYLPLMDYHYRKFSRLYRDHLDFVVAHQDCELAELERNGRRLLDHLEKGLRPALFRQSDAAETEVTPPRHVFESWADTLAAEIPTGPYPPQLIRRDRRLLALRSYTRKLELERVAIEAQLVAGQDSGQSPSGAGP